MFFAKTMNQIDKYGKTCSLPIERLAITNTAHVSIFRFHHISIQPKKREEYRPGIFQDQVSTQQ